MHCNFLRALPLVLKHEGGFVNNPKDPGGATNKGITIKTFRKYVSAKGTVSDLKKLTKAQAGVVYKRHYWDAVMGDDLPFGVDYAVFDNAVNAGPNRAIKQLQELVGAVQDGRIGPNTLAATRSIDPALLIPALCDRRLKFLKSIRRGVLWKEFGRGWLQRVNGVKKYASIFYNEYISERMSQ